MVTRVCVCERERENGHTCACVCVCTHVQHETNAFRATGSNMLCCLASPCRIPMQIPMLCPLECVNASPLARTQAGSVLTHSVRPHRDTRSNMYRDE